MGLGAILVFVLSIIAGFGYREMKVGERLVVYRFGRIISIRSSSPTWVVPFVDKTVRIDLDLCVPGWPSLEEAVISERIESWLVERARPESDRE